MRNWLALLGFICIGAFTASATEERLLEGDLIFLRDHGSDDVGYLVIPQQAPLGGVVLVPDSHGLDQRVKMFADRLAHQGYLVLAVDLYHGRVAADEGAAALMAENVKPEVAARAIRTALRFFESSPRFKVERRYIVTLGDGAVHVPAQVARQRGLAAVTVIDPPPQINGLSELRTRAGILVINSAHGGGFAHQSGGEGWQVRTVDAPPGFWRVSGMEHWRTVLQLNQEFWQQQAMAPRRLLPW